MKRRMKRKDFQHTITETSNHEGRATEEERNEGITKQKTIKWQW